MLSLSTAVCVLSLVTAVSVESVYGCLLSLSTAV